MARILSPMLRRELANLENAGSRQSAMKVLKSYVKDLDSKAIPYFLAEVSETKVPGSSPGECTISLYEVLARVHGVKIVPQIENIMSTIMLTLSSSAGYFPLHQACSKVVPAIARYSMDHSTPSDEKMRIICLLYKPLCDALMGVQESTASGAALCLKTLVEADNWRFASDDMVNEVCLKVAGALEEKETRTSYHMGLVMALAKHNGLISEAYARSFLRSGLQIVTVGAAESSSQKRLSAIQMINSLMKYVDQRSITSELAEVADAMQKCQNDQMEFVRRAAAEALQTAKAITGQKRSRKVIFLSPYTESTSNWRNGSSIWVDSDNEDTWLNGSPPEVPSPESQIIDSFLGFDTFTDSPKSIGQSSFDLSYARRANRRLWDSDSGGVDVSLKDGLFSKACSGCDETVPDSEQRRSDDQPKEARKNHNAEFTGFAKASATSEVSQSAAPSPQRSRSHLTINDFKIYSTPRRLIQSLQDPIDTDSEMSASTHPHSGAEEQSSLTSLNGDAHSYNMKCKAKETKSTETMRMIDYQNCNANAATTLDGTECECCNRTGWKCKAKETKSTETMRMIDYQNCNANVATALDGTESVSSSDNIHEDVSCKMCSRGDSEDKIVGPVNSTKKIKHGIGALAFIFGLCLVFLAILFMETRTGTDELYYDFAPT